MDPHIVRDGGDILSLVPGADAKFKVGLKAWRWKGAESEDAAEGLEAYLAKRPAVFRGR